MSSRRSFIIGFSSIVGANLLSSCSSNKNGLVVSLLQNSIPPQLKGKFHNSFSADDSISFKLKTKLEDLWDLLQTKKGIQANKSNLVTLGDTWLDKAIQKNLIAPLEIKDLEGWGKLPLLYQQLVKRNQQGYPDAEGKIWGAPYRWGTIMIAYRRDKLKDLDFIPQDWSDLWRDSVRDRLSILDQPRVVIGLTLKKLGYSFNTKDLAAIPELKPELDRLNQQVKLYSSDDYLQPLIIGDTWLAVGWSTDIIPITKNYPNIDAVIPQSGTSLWADLWVQSVSSQPTDIINQWIDFCWQPQSAKSISLLTNAASPAILSLNREDLPSELANDSLVIPSESILSKSEFLLPLSETTLEQYKSLWQAINS